MTIRGPWYISAAAVRDYMRIAGLSPADDGPDWDLAERELLRQARAIVEAGKQGRELEANRYQFRGGKPLRLRMIVSFERKAEGDLPQLIAVLPDHAGRTEPYRQSYGGERSRVDRELRRNPWKKR